MPWIRASSGGRAFSETILWENPSPGSSVTDLNATLNDNYTNYDYIKLLFRQSTSRSLDECIEVMYSKAEFSRMKYGVTPLGSPFFMVAETSNSTSVWLCRRGYPTSETAIRFFNCFRGNSSTSESSLLIPYRVIGLK